MTLVFLILNYFPLKCYILTCTLVHFSLIVVYGCSSFSQDVYGRLDFYGKLFLRLVCDDNIFLYSMLLSRDVFFMALIFFKM